MTGTRDRYGEPVEQQSAETPRTHDPRCRAGWLGEDDDGRLVPCLTCRPHLVGRREQLKRITDREISA